MDIPLDEVIHFDGISSASTGAAADADSTPTFAVYEESTDTDIGVGGNMTKRTSLTGNYRGSFTASAANGFEVGKWYNVIGSATIGGIACKGVLKSFRIVLAESVVGEPKVDVGAFGGSAGTFSGGRPEVNASHWGGTEVASANVLIDGAITEAKFAANAITDAKVASDVTIASVTGAVGSVTGAVGSVTGNVGGSVASVTAGVTLANGAHGGAAATLTMKQLTIAADANNSAVVFTGSGTGEGLKITGGATGTAVEIIGGATSGHGVTITTTDGFGVTVDAGQGVAFPTADAVSMTLNGGTGSIVADLNGGVNSANQVGSINAGGITASSIATGAIDADAIAADAVTEIQNGLATAASLTSLTNTVGVAGAGLTAADDAVIAAIAALNNLSSAQVATAVATAMGTAIASETYPADTVVPSRDQLLLMCWAALVHKTVSDDTVTLYKLNGTTPAMTLTIDYDGDGNVISVTRTT